MQYFLLILQPQCLCSCWGLLTATEKKQPSVTPSLPPAHWGWWQGTATCQGTGRDANPPVFKRGVLIAGEKPAKKIQQGVIPAQSTSQIVQQCLRQQRSLVGCCNVGQNLKWILFCLWHLLLNCGCNNGREMLWPLRILKDGTKA